MNILDFLQFLYFYFVSISSSGCPACKTINFKGDSEVYSSVFDDLEYKITEKFLEDTKKISCFSLICCLSNIQLMCVKNEFNKGTSKLGKKALSDVSKALCANKKTFIYENVMYIKENDKINLKKNYDGWIIRKYTDLSAKTIHGYHVKWFKHITEERLDINIGIEDFYNYNRIYLSIAMFDDKWTRKLWKIQRESDVHVSSRVKQKRMFTMVEENFKYAKVESFGISYHVVAFKYDNGIGFDQGQYIIYLIPFTYTGSGIRTHSMANLSALWENFYNSYSKKYIKKIINEMETSFIQFFIPMIKNCKSEFDLYEYINLVSHCNLASTARFEMQTLLNTNENFTVTGDAEALLCQDEANKTNTKMIKADVPYISFIFDMNLEKILFITKDLGL